MWSSNSYDCVMWMLAVLRALRSCRNFFRYWDSVQTDGGRSIHYNKGRFLASYAVKRWIEPFLRNPERIVHSKVALRGVRDSVEQPLIAGQPAVHTRFG